MTRIREEEEEVAVCLFKCRPKFNRNHVQYDVLIDLLVKTS